MPPRSREPRKLTEHFSSPRDLERAPSHHNRLRSHPLLSSSSRNRPALTVRWRVTRSLRAALLRGITLPCQSRTTHLRNAKSTHLTGPLSARVLTLPHPSRVRSPPLDILILILTVMVTSPTPPPLPPFTVEIFFELEHRCDSVCLHPGTFFLFHRTRSGIKSKKKIQPKASTQPCCYDDEYTMYEF
jgi:hypothetical protein